MTQEDKQLLLTDLCGRLPYGVIVNICNTNGMICDVILSEDNITNAFRIPDGWWEYCKPYLRPMSSMTEEEKINYRAFFNYDGVEYPDEYIDWLNKNMFDYRGLIEKGLAIEAPEGMYKMDDEQQ